MRISRIAITTLVLGGLVCLALVAYEMYRYGRLVAQAQVDRTSITKNQEEKFLGTIVVVGESTFDFGTLELNQTGRRTFKIRNEGEEALEIHRGFISCGPCLKTTLSHSIVPSGDELEFAVTYATRKKEPEFSAYLELQTSDPDTPVLRFEITGFVAQPIRVSKEELSIGNITAGEEVSASFRIYGFEDEPIKIVHLEFTSEKTEDQFNLELTPLDIDQFRDQEPRAKSAVQAVVSMTPRDHLGTIIQVLRMTAQLSDRSIPLEVTIRATIVPDIVLVGGSLFLKEKNLLQLDSISNAVGHSTTLFIHVRGERRDEIKLSIGTIDPVAALKATIGEPKTAGKSYLYPLTITIPKGAPLVNRLGTEQGKIGIINIETTHPTVRTLPIYVGFSVE
jgi:hypothetical protein